MLAGRHFDPSNLILEITESAMMHDTETVVQNLHALRALGLRIAVDDFGTGYSSLAYLEQFPVDILKIDRSFVTALTDDDPAGLAQAVIGIGETLGLMTVAEGVENGRTGRAAARPRVPRRPGLPPRQAPGRPRHGGDAPL